MKWYTAAVLAFVHNFCKSTVGLENLTRYGTVKQSSKYLNYGAKNTIDGNKNQIWEGQSCGHTALGKYKAWWRLDIEQLATIHRVVIYYRIDGADRLNGFYIIIGETFNPEKPKEGHECFHDIYDNVMPNVTQDIPCNNVGRFVVIYNERNTTDAYLDLCEVEVFGCLLGKYGNTCKNCSTHCQGQICDILTGRCNCSIGYQGPTCDDECAHGRYGKNCQFKCNCLNGASCNHVDGSCPQGLCAAGWDLNNCSKVSHQESLKGVSFEVFGVCISVVIVLAVLTVMTLVCYFRRKIKHSSPLYEDIRLNAGQRTNEDQVYSELGQDSC